MNSVAGDRKQTLKVLCLDRDSGNILWERTSYEGVVYDDRHRKNTYASSTPVTDGKFLYAFFEAEGLYCYDFAGKLIWRPFQHGYVIVNPHETPQTAFVQSQWRTLPATSAQIVAY